MYPDSPPSWLRRCDDPHGPVFKRKTYGRIFVRSTEDVEKVRAVIRTLDPDEFTYLPQNFIAPYDAVKGALTYGCKFEMRTDLLKFACWHTGVDVLIVTGKDSP